MKTPTSLRMTRRDMCHMIGLRARKLGPVESVEAWLFLAARLEDELSTRDLPKFIDLLQAIRAATIQAKKKST